jgi:hypothetical protein
MRSIAIRYWADRGIRPTFNAHRFQRLCQTREIGRSKCAILGYKLGCETGAWQNASRLWLSVKEGDVAKGQQRSNREKKKPKQDKKKVTAAASPFTSSDQRDKSGKASGKKKK